jgi:hypothetical protein
VSYSLWDLTHPAPAVQQGDFGPYRVGTDTILVPVKLGTGRYYSDWVVPLSSSIGMHKVVWEYVDSETGVRKAVEQEFSVVALDPRFAVAGIQPEAAFVTMVAPPIPKAAFSLYRGTNKSILLQILDDFGNPEDLTESTSITLKIDTNPDIVRDMDIYGAATAGEAVYMFVPNDTTSVAAGNYVAQGTVEFLDSRITKTDQFIIQILEPV